MEIIRSAGEMQSHAEKIRSSGKRIGVVPTMGYFHEGHTSLIRIARERCDVVVTTIFVNPAQFGTGEDFEQYPRDFERDKALAEEAGTDVIFAPDAEEMYPPGFGTFVVPEDGASILEGQVRPSHFRGVVTVVVKLFHLTKPHIAVFGQKDAQQVFVVRRMIRDLNFDIDLVVAPTIREQDGLAKSSRNLYLTAAERAEAPLLYQALKEAESLAALGERKAEKIRAAVSEVLQRAKLATADYVAVVDPETFREVGELHPPLALVAVAVRFGSARLIDNILISVSSKG